MTLRIYNTLSKKKELFKPLESGKVRMYVCGPTVYDSCHIGHARSVVVFDVIARYLKSKGFNVTYVRNFTDVDDKIIARANSLGVDPGEISEKYIKEFYHDMDALNVERATIEPKATEHIEDIIKIIVKLIEKNYAYQVNGDVYFSVNAFEGYGKLSRRKLDEMEAGARIDIDTRKRNPFDFALWKAAKPGEPAWDSPWGKGRPGWHIECSAMSTKYLGDTIDIHGGGNDLIFPHHENEIAQSEAASGKPFVRFWVHNGFVNINQEKMSKSLGNFLMIKDVIKSCHPEAVRFFLLSKHYRSPVDFTDKALDEASSGLDKIYALLLRMEEKTDDSLPAGEDTADYSIPDFWKLFSGAMDDDFNSARGIGILFDAVRTLNRIMDSNNSLSSGKKAEIDRAGADILKIGGILGILAESAKTYFDKKKSREIEKKSIDPLIIDKMLQEREAARKAKDWDMADRIRKELEGMNIILEDRPEGTVWKIS